MYQSTWELKQVERSQIVRSSQRFVSVALEFSPTMLFSRRKVTGRIWCHIVLRLHLTATSMVKNLQVQAPSSSSPMTESFSAQARFFCIDAREETMKSNLRTVQKIRSPMSLLCQRNKSQRTLSMRPLKPKKKQDLRLRMLQRWKNFVSRWKKKKPIKRLQRQL